MSLKNEPASEPLHMTVCLNPDLATLNPQPHTPRTTRQTNRLWFLIAGGRCGSSGRTSEWDQIVFFNCRDLYHKQAVSGERQYEITDLTQAI